jgi:hypothetical protein
VFPDLPPALPLHPLPSTAGAPLAR